MEKNRATKYMPTQKKKECQPPIAESVVLAFIGFSFSFSKGFTGCDITTLVRGIYHEKDIVSNKNND
jgi:hypothetical protein